MGAPWGLSPIVHDDRSDLECFALGGVVDDLSSHNGLSLNGSQAAADVLTALMGPALAAAPQPFCLVDADGRVVAANHAFINAVARQDTPESVPGAALAVLLDDPTVTPTRLSLDEATGAPPLVVPLPPGNAAAAPHRLDTWPVEDAHVGALHAVLFRNVATEQRCEQRARRILDERETFFDHLGDVVFHHTLDGELKILNDAVVETLGYTKEALNAEPLAWPRLIHPEDRPEADRFFKELAGHVGRYKGVFRVRHKDGSWRVLEMRLFAHRDEAGAILGYYGVDRDVTKQMEMVERIRESEARYRSYMDNAPYGVFIAGSDRRYREVNPAGCELAGYTEAELTAMRVGDLVPDDRKALAQRQFASLQEHGHASVQHPILRKDGARRIWSVKAAALGEGLFIGFVSDITERVEAQEALAASEDFLRKVLEGVTDGHWDLDLRTGEERHSEGWQRMLGYAPGEIADSMEAFFALVHPEDRGAVKEAGLDHFRRTDTPFCNEFRLRCKDGSYRWVLNRARVMERDEQGAPVRVVGAHLDITESKRAEHALHESETRYRAIFENANDAILITDDAGVYVDVNPAAGRLLGYTPEALLGRSIRDVAPAGSREGLEAIWTKFLDAGSMQDEVPLRRQDGSEIIVEFAACANFLPGRHMAILRDATQRRGAEDALRRAMVRAEHASNAKSEFLANMSHELRTPLNGVMGMIQLVQASPLDDEQRAHLDIALTACQRLTILLGDILDLSRIEAGKLRIVQELFSPTETLRSVEELFRIQAQQAGVTLRLVTHPGVPERLLGDPQRLRQVLFNLAGNAIKFAPGGEVTVEAAALPHHHPGMARLLFLVRDDGDGVADDEVARIFDAFTQLEKTYTRQHQGAGLGLAIVRRLVNAMGGSLCLHTELNQGATFAVSLPFKTPRHEAAARDDHTAPAFAGAGRRVLVVEDDHVNRLVLTQLLRHLDFVVEEARNGQHALDLLDAHRYHCVFMDVQMPVLHGLEATKRLREREQARGLPRTPVVAVTAFVNADDRARMDAAGMDDFLAKPVLQEKLVTALERVLGADHTAAKPTAPNA